jgi:gliding motility-associated-like protein
VTPTTDTTYYLKAEKIAGCFAYDTIHVKVRDARRVTIGADTAVCAGSFLKIDAGNSFSSYQWSNGSTTSFIEVDERNLYWVETTDDNGCKTRDSIKMEWKACETALWIPDAFTPNGDGKNDKLNINYKGYFLQFEFRIYNRWGQLVFSTKNPRQSWDGSRNGEKLKTDTFIWSCTYQLYGEGKKTAKGTVTVIR